MDGIKSTNEHRGQYTSLVFSDFTDFAELQSEANSPLESAYQQPKSSLNTKILEPDH